MRSPSLPSPMFLAAALCALLVTGCTPIVAYDHPKYHHLRAERYLAMPVSSLPSPPDHPSFSVRPGAFDRRGHIDPERTLPAGSSVYITRITTEGEVRFEHPRLCRDPYCVVQVELEDRDSAILYIDDLFVAHDPLEGLDAHTHEHVRNHRVVEGMTTREVILALGEPTSTPQTEHSGREATRWNYRDRHLVIQDGRVVAVEQ